MSPTTTHNPGEIPTARILDLIRSKREEVSNQLTYANDRNQLNEDDTNSMRLLNDRLANDLSMVFLRGRPLAKLHALRTPEDLLRLLQKPVTDQEYFAAMSELIEEDELGSRNPEIRKTAIDLIRTVAKQYLPATGKTEISPSSIYDLEGKFIEPEEVAKYYTICNIARVQAHAIFEFVRLRINYLSEGGENLQCALHTLLVGGGDCDDLAILTASLLRSLGFAIYLKFIPGHVFTGVFLGELMKVPVSSLPPDMQQTIPEKMIKESNVFSVQYWAVPLDIRQFHLKTEFGDRADFDVFDIYTGEYERILRAILNRVAEHVKDKDENEVQRVLDKFMGDDYFGKVVEQVATVCGNGNRYCITDGHPYLVNAHDLGLRFHEQNLRVLKGDK